MASPSLDPTRCDSEGAALPLEKRPAGSRRRRTEPSLRSGVAERVLVAAFDALAGHLDFGVIILGENRVILYASPMVPRLLALRSDITIRSNILSTSHAELAQLLLQPKTRRHGRSAWACLIGTDRTQILVHRPHLRRADDPHMLLLYSPRRRRLVPESLLRRIYGLTAAEAELTIRLVGGEDLIRAAASLGLSIHTVRTHLKKIFGKLEVRSQVDLIRLLLGGPLTPD